MFLLLAAALVDPIWMHHIGGCALVPSPEMYSSVLLRLTHTDTHKRRPYLIPHVYVCVLCLVFFSLSPLPASYYQDSKLSSLQMN